MATWPFTVTPVSLSMERKKAVKGKTSDRLFFLTLERTNVFSSAPIFLKQDKNQCLHFVIPHAFPRQFGYYLLPYADFHHSQEDFQAHKIAGLYQYALNIID